MNFLSTFSAWLVDIVQQLGYGGVFVMTFLESTFVPVPAELTMIPAGYLAHRGHMNFWLVWGWSITGTVAGSYFNYWLAKHYGRRFLLAYGKYMLFPPEKVEKIERYFASHGEISILTGRLIPGLRHFISFPAGLAHMHLKKFCLYTAAGGGVWMLTLIVVGYLIGGNTALVRHYMPLISYMVLGVVALGVLLYIRNHQNKLRKALLERKTEKDGHGLAE
ncbi:MAG: DedA family protein [Alphaproteobacteria bacterium]|nr:DedA family protein [Alphaproteobacteria bacterium]